MAYIRVTEKDDNLTSVHYIDLALKEAFSSAGCVTERKHLGSRAVLDIDCPDEFFELFKKELNDKIADVLTVNYKYSYLSSRVKPKGLKEEERELLLTAIIAADLEEDKKYSLIKLKDLNEVAIDGIYNFRLKSLKKKWEEVASYMPEVFIGDQLKDFITYLLEGKKRRVIVEHRGVYDMHYRKLIRSDLLKGEDLKIIKEILLSGCGEVELNSKIPEPDEYYLKEYFGERVTFEKGYYVKN